ncbi:MAG: tRNA preQ1(34) S-adenosylmethionine ribosyltransferase-isomerase QueA [Patescibacteria group bacterium]
MRVSDFTYNLPVKLIAQHPPIKRGTTRLLVLDKATGAISHNHYKDFADYVRPGDVVILNNTKVIKARLVAKNTKNQTRELLLLEDHHNTDFTHRRALYRGKLHTGETLDINGTKITIEAVLNDGIAQISSPINLLDLADKNGSVPLPPYMKRAATSEDTERYQTVFAQTPGSVAAPTASLNFTHELEHKLKAKGAVIVYLTLHVGLGTFLPIRIDDIEHHKMHSEYYEISTQTIQAIKTAKQTGNKIFAIGTTVARTLEHAHSNFLSDHLKNWNGEADIFIYPGYEFQIVDALLTNFHAPKSTVLMLAAAFAGWDNLKYAYEEAIKEQYAFLSYGDSMLIV